MKSAAAVRSASENAICTTTSGLRGKNFQRRTTVSSPACSFRSPITAAFDNFSAGPSAKASVPKRQKANVAASTGTLSPVDQTMSIGSALPNDATRKSDDHSPSTIPKMPPLSARTKPSLSNCLTIRARLAPSASRIAISFRRAVPRARSMLARFRQATSNTTPDIPKRSGASRLILVPLVGLVLRLKRESCSTMKVWSFCSTG